LKNLDKHFTFIQVKELLDNPETREQTLEQLKMLSPESDSLKGLIAFLAKNEWNYAVVKQKEDNATVNSLTFCLHKKRTKFG
jgi:hypothetical protein